MPYVRTAPPVLTTSGSNSRPLSHDTPEWFPRVPGLVASMPYARGAAGPGDDDDDDESEGGVGNIDPEDDEGYDEEDDDEEEDTLWAAGASSPSPPKRA